MPLGFIATSDSTLYFPCSVTTQIQREQGTNNSKNSLRLSRLLTELNKKKKKCDCSRMPLRSRTRDSVQRINYIFLSIRICQCHLNAWVIWIQSQNVSLYEEINILQFFKTVTCNDVGVIIVLSKMSHVIIMNTMYW